MSSIDVDQKVYRSFLSQQNVLEKFRLYLEVTPSFLDEIERNQLFTEDELMIIRKLEFPSNRNEFLKLLVKKRWQKDEFAKFSDLLDNTQHSNLSADLIEKAEAYVAEVQAKDVSLLMKDPEKNSVLTGSLASIPLAAKNQVLVLLREKDQLISKLTKEKENLQTQVSNLIIENDGIKRNLMVLDREVTTTFNELNIETENEIGLAALREKFHLQTKIIQGYKQQAKASATEIVSLKQKISALIEENIKLKKSTKDWSNSYKDLKSESSEQITKMSAEIEELKDQIEFLQIKLADLELEYETTTEVHQEEDTEVQERLIALESENRQLAASKERALKDMYHYKEEMRKLLKSLSFDKHPIEHARTLVYLNKRKEKQLNGQNRIPSRHNTSESRMSIRRSLSDLNAIPEEEKITGSKIVLSPTKDEHRPQFPSLDSSSKLHLDNDCKEPTEWASKKELKFNIENKALKQRGLSGRTFKALKTQKLETTDRPSTSPFQSTSDKRDGKISSDSNKNPRPVKVVKRGRALQIILDLDVPLNSPNTGRDSSPSTTREHEKEPPSTLSADEVQCITCLKIFKSGTNHSEACRFHDPLRQRKHVGSLQLWSCCGNLTDHPGCQTGYHIPLH